MAATTLACGLAVAAGVLVSIGWMVTPIVSFGLGWIGLGCAICTDRSHDVSRGFPYGYSVFNFGNVGLLTMWS